MNSSYKIQAVALELDLRDPDLLGKISDATKKYEIGLLVYNAAYSIIGSFFKQSIEDHMKVTDVNCRAVVILAHYFGGLMKERNHGGIVLMSLTNCFSRISRSRTLRSDKSI